ncbi:MAG: WD40 repeat domain-containing protein [Alphaproteobacteria bacterium]|nr:WD40 repeat domain-containing protein [Alphaproteobacteria bacterium]
MTDTVYAQWALGAPILSLCSNRRGDWMAVACADGGVRFLPASDEAIAPVTVSAHKGAFLLAPDADAHAFLSAGEDGTFSILDPLIEAPTVLEERSGQVLSGVSSTPHGEKRAYGAGRDVIVLRDDGTPQFPKPMTITASLRGMSFCPDGTQLAVSCDGRVFLWSVDPSRSEPDLLSEEGVALEPVWGDGVLFAFLRDGALGGWTLGDRAVILLPGYDAPPLSMGFSAGGRFLVTSGAPQALCWEKKASGFASSPFRLGEPGKRLVSFVAPHPSEALVALGYDDGLLVLAPLDGRREIILRPPCGAGVCGLSWNGPGDALFAAVRPDILLLFTLKSVRKAFSYAR